jgi:peroxiredoxin
MYQHERSLVQKYKGRKFVLMGVNADEPEALKNIIQKNSLTWNSWADGHGGPICKKWNIRFFPTTVLIDGKGVIRYKNLRAAELENAIDKLVKEEESRSP